MSATPRRALLVIDVQNEYVTGRLRIAYPPLERSLANVGRAMDAARARGIPVVVVRNGTPAGSPIFERGSAGWELHPVVAGRPFDHLVDKRLPSAFTGTDLEEWLRARDIDCASSHVIEGAVRQSGDEVRVNPYELPATESGLLERAPGEPGGTDAGG